MGAGAIGCFVGARLALGGAAVTLVGRKRVLDPIAAHGITLEDLEGAPRHARPGLVGGVEEPSALPELDVVLVATKGKDTERAATQLQGAIPAHTPVVSLQNGVDNPRRLAAHLGAERVLGGSVSWNVVWRDEHQTPTLRRSTSGPVVVESRPGPASPTERLLRAFAAADLDARGHAEIERVLHTKLLFNLNNAVNALSGVTLREQLADRRYRRVMAAIIAEGLAAMRAANIAPLRLGMLDARLAARVLPLPDLVFRTVARSMIKIDPEARSSMADDLSQRRSTEVDDLNGAVVRLGAAHGVPTPLNERIVALIHAAEEAAAGSPRLSPEQIAG